MILTEQEYLQSIKEWIKEFDKQLEQEKNIMHHSIILLKFDRPKAEEFSQIICRLLMVKGISLVIDTSVGGYIMLEKLWESHRLPYIQISITKFPFIYSIIKYIEAKFGNDYAIIFQNTLGELSIIRFHKIRIIVTFQKQKKYHY